MKNIINVEELGDYAKELLNIAAKTMPKESRAFLREEGKKLLKKTKSAVKTKVKRKTGKFYKSIKKGKVYIYRGNGGTAIRVYSNAPHAHLLENGHRVVKNGKEIGFAPGNHIFEDVGKAFEGEFKQDIDSFLDKVFD